VFPDRKVRREFRAFRVLLVQMALRVLLVPPGQLDLKAYKA
jgi:hypothetical protein